jgi:hypothetical protein
MAEILSLRCETDASEGGVAMADLACRLAEELRMAADLAEDCQAALNDVLTHGVTAESLMRFQALDVLTQQLVEIARLLQRLGPMPGLGQVAFEVLDDVRLADVRRRLQARAPHAASNGEAELW